MTQDDKIRALPVFDEYLDLSESARERMRADLQRRDPQLLRALETLLQADAATSALDTAPVELLAQARATDPAPAREDPRIGTRLGAWRIDGLIAEGGMGTVYAAHRDDGQYQQRAALKCVRATLATSELLQAFVAERNHLARLEHPGIATLLDGGVGEDGHPWFAMRYVNGMAIDVWCDRQRSSVGERVDLLIQVCEALSYAHAQGIVHRDIKPPNVLVSADGRAHLVDFGISSHFTGDDSLREPIAVTPDYAAPEARQHGVHAPAADLYALGVLSYRLLCGQWPLPLNRLRDLIPLSIGEPLPMDALLKDASETIAHQRGARDLAVLRRELSGDLSAIALKAVATRPQDRYPSVDEFGRDLRRWREHRPIGIRPGGPWSRVRKWRRRNPAAALLGTVLMLAMVAGTGLSLWQRRQAAREAEATQAVSQLFASTLGSATLSGLGNTPFSSRALLEKTEREMAKLPLDDQPALRARSLATLARSYAMIGDYAYAARLTEQAQRIGADRDNDGFIAATRVAILNIRSDYADAASLASARIAELGNSDSAQARVIRVTLLGELAMAQWGQGTTPTALRTLDLAFDQAQSLGPGHEEIQAQLLILRARFRSRLLRFDQAEDDARRAIALVEHTNPILADDARERLIFILSWKVGAGRIPLAQQLLANRQRTLGERHPKTGRAWVLLAYSQFPDVTKETVLKGRELIAAAYGREHPEYVDATVIGLPMTTHNAREESEGWAWGLRVRESKFGPDNEQVVDARRNYAMSLFRIPPEMRRPDDIPRALALLRQTLDEKRRAGIPAPLEEMFLGHYLGHFGRDEDLEQASALLTAARQDMRRYFKPTDLFPTLTELFWDRLLYRRGRFVEADRNFAARLQANADWLRSDRIDPESLHKNEREAIHAALLYRAFYAYQTCDRPRAEAFLRQAIDFSTRAFSTDAGPADIAKNFLDDLQKRGRISGVDTGELLAPAELDTMNRLAQRCPAHSRQ
ncbi:serine/threonine protein kinase [Lysobacter sp. CA199]|uniref:serine/threonine protein kinase n=1 Tax=Lysobacter sp. CA199 TaxID=3455608 RepID=UPI003F8D6305